MTDFSYVGVAVFPEVTQKAIPNADANLMLFDMVRTRENGVLVPRYQVGRQRAVRGSLVVEEVQDSRLARHIRTARFKMEDHGATPPPDLRDVQLIYAASDMLVLNGIEQLDLGMRVVEYAQSWVLSSPQGPEAQGYMGPPFRG